MRSTTVLLGLLVCSCSGSGPDGGMGGGSSGGGTGGAGGGGGGSDVCAALGVELSSPTSPAYTNGTVTFVVSGMGMIDEAVLVLDGTQLAVVPGSFRYDWDTRAVPEGSHMMLARATKGATVCDSAPVTVVVDRTPPTIVSRTPAPGATNVWFGDPIRVVFSEPLTLASFIPPAWSLTGAAAAQTTHPNESSLETVLSSAQPVPSTLQLTLTSEMTDLAGNPLAPASWSWQMPLWAQVGGQVGQGERTFGSALAQDGTGALLAARGVLAANGVYVPRVTKWSGTAWLDLGGIYDICDGGQGSFPQALVVPASGRPVLIYLQGTSPSTTLNEAHVKEWDGAAWQPLGAALGAPGADAWGASLAVESNGTVVAAYVDGLSLRVARFTSGAWQQIGGALNVTGTDPGLMINVALDANDRPVVAFKELTGLGRKIYVKRWTGSAWMQLGGALNPSGDTGPYSPEPLALDSTGTPYVLFDEVDGQYAAVVRVKKWNGADWDRVGPPLNVDFSRGLPEQLRIDAQGRLVTAWTEQRPANPYVLPYTARVARFERGQWQVLGGSVQQQAGPTVWQSQIDGLVLQRDEPVVLHSEFVWNSTQQAVFVNRWNAPPQAPFGLTARATSTPCTLPQSPPALLSATGCFADLVARRPAAGVIPYRVTSPLWTDAAAKRRWLVLPTDGGTIGFTDAGSWDVPIGTVLIKEFAVQLAPGNEDSERPMETRFLVRRDATTWEGYSYQWRDTFDEADLLAGSSAVTKSWALDAGTHAHQYPSRGQCLQCHSQAAGRVLGLQTAQLHGNFDYGSAVDDQLRALDHIGAFGGTFPSGPLGDLPRLINPYDSTEPLPERGRAYLHANCSHCHNGSLFWDARITTPLSGTGLCSTVASGSSVSGANRIAVADAGASEIVRRINVRGGVQMPPLGTLAVDTAAVSTVSAWINGMTSCP